MKKGSEKKEEQQVIQTLLSAQKRYNHLIQLSKRNTGGPKQLTFITPWYANEKSVNVNQMLFSGIFITLTF
ncbi:hypothetical protein DN752_17705 [Echinicola strongylocentroti]|uniref:Uncharacterized protein n=1 Tax=Echinicola strongylocentroti TaxID=1795355 RepID=A0A2Z4IM80_9BACT|nr:hypothetical protein DN752_17705 [Echinicola strongylocentroti]